MNKIYIISGIICVAIAILIAFLPHMLVEDTVSITDIPPIVETYTMVDPISGNTMYLPATGTEKFAWEDKEWTYINTGLWAYPNFADEYGSLYQSNVNQWMIVTMRGQIIEGASNGELPTLKGENYE